MNQRTEEARWRDLESNAHLPDVQELIRQEIQSGTISVRPKPGGGICIVPVGMSENDEPIEVEAAARLIAGRGKPTQGKWLAAGRLVPASFADLMSFSGSATCEGHSRFVRLIRESYSTHPVVPLTELTAIRHGFLVSQGRDNLQDLAPCRELPPAGLLVSLHGLMNSISFSV